MLHHRCCILKIHHDWHPDESLSQLEVSHLEVSRLEVSRLEVSHLEVKPAHKPSRSCRRTAA